MVKAPRIEWRCGSVQHASLLQALEKATDATITLLHDGVVQWTRDCTRPLHEFTCRVVGYVLQLDVGEAVPLLRDPTESLASATLRSQISLPPQTGTLPASFFAAYEGKQQWLAGNKSPAEIQTLAAQVMADMRMFWPSNFCLHVNSQQYAYWCVLSALNLEAPWLGAHGCAQTATAFMTHRAGCAAQPCTELPYAPPTPAREAGGSSPKLATRGVSCPQAGNRAIEAIATQAMRATADAWWPRLDAELAALLQT